jgi:hypothetical protein
MSQLQLPVANLQHLDPITLCALYFRGLMSQYLTFFALWLSVHTLRTLGLLIAVDYCGCANC